MHYFVIKHNFRSKVLDFIAGGIVAECLVLNPQCKEFVLCIATSTFNSNSTKQMHPVAFFVWGYKIPVIWVQFHQRVLTTGAHQSAFECLSNSQIFAWFFCSVLPERLSKRILEGSHHERLLVKLGP